MGRAYVAFGRTNPQTYRVLFMHKPHDGPETEDVLKMLDESGFTRLVDTVRECIDAGFLEGETMLVATQIWTAVHGLTSLLIIKPDFPWPPVDDLLDATTDMLLRGLAPRTTDP